MMTEQSQDTGAAIEEKRTHADRRSHKHDELFGYAVGVGYFVDLRKGERRQGIAPVELNL